ncbi:hypothetical protein B0A48_18615 [Cryoendolithus antarcticus]|uniref:Phosphatidic acid phosphatase type 2/haloperoxidase domain-containing protein n=1 Tax=Cryoendolithus antarcticus TaxID=1507870 RepID=A0A1V8S8Y2_9PEZI|nr:hypothetical protein B0A48_18615 [Cryoendolithus antarcticus]
MSSWSKRLIASYILDWVVIVAIAAAGAGLNFITPYQRPFSLLDLSLSFPFKTEQISITVLGIVSLIGPAAVIAVVTLLFVPGPQYSRQLSRRKLISLKLWELEKGLAGLALSVATAFFVTQGMKNMFGKPRPNSMGMCMPDLTNVQAHAIGGYGQGISDRWVLVNSSICTQTDISVLRDAFRSFPSGHCSFSWSGLLYLTFFICSKFAVVIPHLPLISGALLRSVPHELLPLHESNASARPSGETGSNDSKLTLRDLAASPPNHLIVIAFIPVAVAIYICSTRFVDYYHFGFDIISGSLIGIISASSAFRWYHMPLGRGEGWAWGPRSKNCAFGIGVGVGSYVARDV